MKLSEKTIRSVAGSAGVFGVLAWVGLSVFFSATRAHAVSVADEEEFGPGLLDVLRTPTSLVEGTSSASSPVSVPGASPLDFAIQRMRAEGLSEGFIKMAVASFDEGVRDKIVPLSILGFLKKADYSGHLSHSALKNTRSFMKKHRRTFDRAASLHEVDPQVVASLLWVETKHGKQFGKFSVSAIFLSLIQAEHPEMVAASLQTLLEKAPDADEEMRTKTRERSRTKALWAMGELKALAEIHERDPRQARTLRGSFAGAFGYPQFVPSSYVRWGQSSRGGDSRPDLFRPEDAILSVANYLRSNGWKAGDPESQRAALFHYNRSQGYVDVILKIAGCVNRVGRGLASESDSCT